jgi:mannose-6-phosphate isomerase-like protein (cupin superfamily)
MFLEFDRMEEKVVPHFKGGEGEAHICSHVDEMGKIVRCTLPVGSSIGVHTHETNCEVVYILSGSGTCLDDGEAFPIRQGMCQYCPRGHHHSIINTGTEPLVLLGVIPEMGE